MNGLPDIVAVVNVTRDSFSDGGRFLSPQAAIAHARDLAASGASIIELGPASSNPDASPVSAEDQIARIAPILDALSDAQSSAESLEPDASRNATMTVSIDATDPEVLRYALGRGVSMLNDVRGFPEPERHPEWAESDALLVVVHSLLALERATRDQASPRKVLDSIERFFDQRLAELVRAGVREDRLIVDPGMGFFLGSDPRASLAVLHRVCVVQ